MVDKHALNAGGGCEVVNMGRQGCIMAGCCGLPDTQRRALVSGIVVLDLLIRAKTKSKSGPSGPPGQGEGQLLVWISVRFEVGRNGS